MCSDSIAVVDFPIGKMAVMPLDNPGLAHVVSDIQQLCELEGARPMKLATLGNRLDKKSRNFMEQHGLKLRAMLDFCPQPLRLWEEDGCAMVCKERTAHERENLECLRGKRRGEAQKMMRQLSEENAFQEVVREVMCCLLMVPDRTLLVSKIGNRLSRKAQDVLRATKMRMVQLLRCFLDDFILQGQGPAISVFYLHVDTKEHFEFTGPINQIDIDINLSRQRRLMELAADFLQPYRGEQSVSAQDILKRGFGTCLSSSSDACVVFIDCRSSAEQEVSSLPGAILQEDFTWNLLFEEHPKTLFVAFCAMGCSSAKWIMSALGRSHAPPGARSRLFWLMGGVASWAHASGWFQDRQTGRMTRMVHCGMPELLPLYPVGSGDNVVCSESVELSDEERLSVDRATSLRCARLGQIARESRLRLFPSVFCRDAVDILEGNVKAPLVFVDCRDESEIQVSTIDWPLVLTKEQFYVRAPELIRVGMSIVAFCTVGTRAGAWCEKLVGSLSQEDGGGHCLDNAATPQHRLLNLYGGLAAWLHCGGDLVDSSGQKTQRLHAWCKACADVFPVEGVQLVLNEAAPEPPEAKPFVSARKFSGRAFNPAEIIQQLQTLKPEVLSDSLSYASTAIPYNNSRPSQLTYGEPALVKKVWPERPVQ